MYDDCLILSLRFPQKLWKIVNECKSGAIRWSLTGSTILLDYKKFQEQYLDAGNSIFKTKNITSFIRQLNLYGFRKVTSHNRDPICNLHNPDVHEFLHESFRTGRPDLLSRVCRKTAGKIKYSQQRDNPRNTDERDFHGQNSNRMSRLRMCRLALTKALEQITQEYHRKCCSTRTTSFTEASNSSGAELFGLGLFVTAPNHETEMEWIEKRPVSFSAETPDNSSDRLTYSWCVHAVDKRNGCLRFESTG